MRKSKAKIILSVFFTTLISSVLAYLAKSDSLLDNLLDYFEANNILTVSENKVARIKDILLLSSIAFSTIFISLRLALSEFEKNTIIKQRECLIRYQKENFLSVLQSKGLITHNVLNIRLFVPQKGILETGKTLLNKILLGKVRFTKEFCIKNIDGLGDKGKTDNLSFVVFPKNKIQGLVGECYTQKAIVYDDNLEITYGGYNLNEYQLNKTCDLKFCLCVPIYNKKGEVVSIMSFDSPMVIKIKKEQKKDWRMAVINYSLHFSECFQDLFK